MPTQPRNTNLVVGDRVRVAYTEETKIHGIMPVPDGSELYMVGRLAEHYVIPYGDMIYQPGIYLRYRQPVFQVIDPDSRNPTDELVQLNVADVWLQKHTVSTPDHLQDASRIFVRDLPWCPVRPGDIISVATMRQHVERGRVVEVNYDLAKRSGKQQDVAIVRVLVRDGKTSDSPNNFGNVEVSVDDLVVIDRGPNWAVGELGR